MFLRSAVEHTRPKRDQKNGGALDISPASVAWDGMTDRPSNDTLPPFWLTAIVVTAVVVADVATWFYFAVGCAVRENASDRWNDFCRNPALTALPLMGIAVLAVGGTYSRRIGRSWPLVVSALLGLLLAAGFWLLMGDPAGNFDGLLKD